MCSSDLVVSGLAAFRCLAKSRAFYLVVTWELSLYLPVEVRSNIMNLCHGAIAREVAALLWSPSAYASFLCYRLKAVACTSSVPEIASLKMGRSEYSDIGFLELTYSMTSMASTYSPGDSGQHCAAALPFYYTVRMPFSSRTMEFSEVLHAIMYKRGKINTLCTD